jgi:8-oxo-dGTP diphosphatase
VGYTVRMSPYSYEYARPAFTVDTVVFAGQSSARRILLVKRGGEPYRGFWALPGGFVDEGEFPVAAALRELAEETGLACETPLVCLGVWGDPGRDPRGWTVTGAYLADIGPALPEVTGGDDAVEAAWWPVDDLPAQMAFDHGDIVVAALGRLDCL